MGVSSAFLFIHPNNFLSQVQSQEMIVSLSITFLFFSIIPSLYFFAGEETGGILNAIQRLVKKGKGVIAVNSYSQGVLLAILFFPILAFVYFSFLQEIYFSFKSLIFFILIIYLLSYSTLSIRHFFLVILFSVFGLMTYKFDVLLPMLSGFYTVPYLLGKTSKIPYQKKARSKLTFQSKAYLVSLSVFVSSFFSFLPGVTSTAAVFTTKFFARLKSEELIFFNGATNSFFLINSFIALYLLNSIKSGAALALTSFKSNLFYIYGIVLITAFLCFLLINYFSINVLNLFSKIPALFLKVFTLTFLISVCIFLLGPYSLIILFTSSSLSFLATSMKVSKGICSCSLIAPAAVLIF